VARNGQCTRTARRKCVLRSRPGTRPRGSRAPDRQGSRDLHGGGAGGRMSRREPGVISETGLSDLPDRIVVSPGHGRLSVPLPKAFGTEGEVVRAGDVIAVVVANSQRL